MHDWNSVLVEQVFLGIETASNIITSAIRLLEQIDESYTPEQAENLTRKLINAIKLRDPGKFTRTVRKTDANS